MAGYDPQKAALFNQLRQQGLTEDQAFAQAGITDQDAINYAINNVPGDTGRGTLGPAVTGASKVAGVDYQTFTAAELRAQNEWNGPIPADYPVIANSAPSDKTFTSYTTTSTVSVSGGGSTTVISGARQPTAASQALQPAIDAKQAEIDQFTRDNPSNFVRRRQGLPPLTPEETQARDAQLLALQNQRGSLINQQLDAQQVGQPTVITQPNTTTTTTTVTTGTSATNVAVPAPAGADPAIDQQTEVALGVAQQPQLAPIPQPDPEIAAQDQRELNRVASLAPGAQPDPEIVAQDQRELNRVASLAPSPQPPDPLAEAAAAFADEEAQAFAPQPPDPLAEAGAAFADEDAQGFGGQTPADIEDAEQGLAMRAAITRAQEQSTLQQRYNQTTTGDWRVRIRLAPNATYLYKDKSNALLAPLSASDGVIFPYVPTIQTSYQAKYDSTLLTHSNYQGYFYKGSMVGDIQIAGTFTAQDTREAQYLLAVIHFFRSVTKMFYGQDRERGTPPPMVFLSGLGAYQFNNHPCVVSNFNYSLPNAVDYIRVDPNNQGQNLVINRNQVSSSPVSTIETALNRISSLINLATGNPVQPGAQGKPVDLGFVGQTVSGTTQTTYVPTKMEITVTLLPLQTRNQVSQQFSLKNFANGNLLKGGFW